MSKVRAHISISLDDYGAGPNESHENPLGEGGEQLHDWVVELKSWREPHGMEGGVVNASTRWSRNRWNVGAEDHGGAASSALRRGPVGRRFWQGWWGEDPPFSTCRSSSSPTTSASR